MKGSRKVISCMEKAIGLSPEWGRPYVMALVALFSATSMGLAAHFTDQLEKQSEWLAKVDELESKTSPTRAMLAFVDYTRTGDRDAVRATMSALLRHLPFDPDVLLFGGYVFLFAGEAEPGMECLLKLSKFSMHTPYAAAVHSGLVFGFAQLGHDKEALMACEETLQINPNYVSTHRHRAVALAQMGRLDEAAEQLVILDRIVPDETITKVRARLHFQDTEGARRYLEGLRLAGMPE